MFLQALPPRASANPLQSTSSVLVQCCRKECVWHQSLLHTHKITSQIKCTLYFFCVWLWVLCARELLWGGTVCARQHCRQYTHRQWMSHKVQTMKTQAWHYYSGKANPDDFKNIKIFAGTSNPALADEVSHYLGNQHHTPRNPLHYLSRRFTPAQHTQSTTITCACV